jgi:hypothetical protein
MNDASAAARVNDFSLGDTSEFENGLNDDLRARVKCELEPGERLLWAARCDTSPEPRGVGFYVVCIVTLFFLGMGLFFAAPPRAGRRAGDDSTIGVGLVFLGIDCLLMMGLIASWNGRRTLRRQMTNTLYAATDRRVILWAPEPKDDAIRVQALGRGQFKNLARIERPDGSGTLEFYGTRADVDFGYYHSFRFAGVPDVRRVEQIVRNNLMTSEPNT